MTCIGFPIRAFTPSLLTVSSWSSVTERIEETNLGTDANREATGWADSFHILVSFVPGETVAGPKMMMTAAFITGAERDSLALWRRT